MDLKAAVLVLLLVCLSQPGKSQGQGQVEDPWVWSDAEGKWVKSSGNSDGGNSGGNSATNGGGGNNGVARWVWHQDINDWVWETPQTGPDQEKTTADQSRTTAAVTGWVWRNGQWVLITPRADDKTTPKPTTPTKEKSTQPTGPCTPGYIWIDEWVWDACDDGDDGDKTTTTMPGQEPFTPHWEWDEVLTQWIWIEVDVRTRRPDVATRRPDVATRRPDVVTQLPDVTTQDSGGGSPRWVWVDGQYVWQTVRPGRRTTQRPTTREVQKEWRLLDGQWVLVEIGSDEPKTTTAYSEWVWDEVNGRWVRGAQPITTQPPTPRSRQVCSMPSVTGRCRGGFERWFYSYESGACETFTYGGCDGNDNNFETKKKKVPTATLR